MNKLSEKALEDFFWQAGGSMSKFHAFTFEDGHSLCGKWFMGGRAYGVDYDNSFGKDSKCKECIKAIRYAIDKHTTNNGNSDRSEKE